jgi:hypothetical protein
LKGGTRPKNLLPQFRASSLTDKGIIKSPDTDEAAVEGVDEGR